MIKLEVHWNHSRIIEASWPKVTPKKLKEWWVYLYGNFLYKTRRILKFDSNWTHLYYTDDISFFNIYNPWCYCSKAHFCKVCPTEATPEEIEFLNEEYLK